MASGQRFCSLAEMNIQFTKWATRNSPAQGSSAAFRVEFASWPLFALFARR